MEIEELLQHPRKVWNVGKEQGLKTEWGGKPIGLTIPMTIHLLSTFVDSDEFPEALIPVVCNAERKLLKKMQDVG